MAGHKISRNTPKAAASMQHLERRGDSFRVAVAVPRPLQKLFGAAIIRQPLGVMSEAEANRQKPPHVAKIKEWFRHAQLTGQLPADYNGGALSLEELVTLTRHQLDGLISQGRDEEALDLESLTIDAVAETRGADMAAKLRQVLGQQGQMPISLSVDAWLSVGALRPSTLSERRTEAGRFLSWAAKDQGLPEAHITFDMIDRRFANRYMTEGMEGVHPATKRKRVGALRSYWAWAADNDHYKADVPLEQRVNPWKASKAKIGTAPKPKKRPFTDAETRQMINAATAIPRYGEVLKTLALTGARVSEIVKLRVCDVNTAERFIRIPDGKTDAAARDVPIHPQLADIFRDRMKGKTEQERLFHDIPLPKNPAQGAGHAVSKYVGRLRDRLKIGKREAEGRRQAIVDTHSFRRWFTKKAVEAVKTRPDAGFDGWTIARVIGHDAEDDPLGLTMVRYAGVDDLGILRRCVEAVNLPPE